MKNILWGPYSDPMIGAIRKINTKGRIEKTCHAFAIILPRILIEFEVEIIGCLGSWLSPWFLLKIIDLKIKYCPAQISITIFLYFVMSEINHR
jgi:hypothetical protein